MIRAREMRKGKVCLHDGALYVCQDNQHVAKGNKRSYMQAKLRNIENGSIELDPLPIGESDPS